MSAVIFTGPSLPPSAARKLIDAEILPPVAQGDIIRVVGRKPDAIGIIDGFFENVPSVWHKEILFALSNGIPVYGAASMGALRAAELHAFGMIGVGAVFEAFRDGALEDDDEVAVVHGPAELGYLPLSEAMVNIRCTLSDARAGGILSEQARKVFERVAKEMPYKSRSYDLIARRAGEGGVAASEVDRFRAWLPSGRRDAKREDAVSLVRTVSTHVAGGLARAKPRFHFEHTTLWARAFSDAGRVGAMRR